jgi:hypothetical protein
MTTVWFFLPTLSESPFGVLEALQCVADRVARYIQQPGSRLMLQIKANPHGSTINSELRITHTELYLYPSQNSFLQLS